MKATVEEEYGQRKYPYLGKLKNDELVVLFIEESTGVVLVKDSDDDWEVGDLFATWQESQFTPLQGRLILEN